jgi:hypothetical protein
MKKQDPALECSNPRLIAAIYFGLLSVVGTILINALLTTLGINEVVPLFGAIILGMIVASTTGAIMGNNIIDCKKPYKLKTFFMGFFMVIISLPFFAAGLVVLMKQQESEVLIKYSENIIYLYLYVLAYSYLLFGILLALASGIAAMYLRGQLIYDILATYQSKNIRTIPKSPMEKSKLEHSDRVSLKKENK